MSSISLSLKCLGQGWAHRRSLPYIQTVVWVFFVVVWVLSVGFIPSTPSPSCQGASRSRCQVEAVQSSSSLSHPSADGVYEIGGLLPIWAVVVIAGTALAAVTFFATSNSEPPRFHWVRNLGSPNWEGGCAGRYPGTVRPLITFHANRSLRPLLRDFMPVQVPFFLVTTSFHWVAIHTHIQVTHLRCTI